MATCPCCSNVLLRHIRKGAFYWLCRSCWAEMPNLEEHQSTTRADIRGSLLLQSIPQTRHQLASFQPLVAKPKVKQLVA